MEVPQVQFFHVVHMPSFNEVQQIKDTDCLIQCTDEKNKDNFMIDVEEMMSCCLMKGTHQTAQESLLTKREIVEYSFNWYTVIPS